ncbi:DgyrCDS2343 [Dimorphilus gyrociliatus]|uniref:DgyrCDS2343 n=1 Tax=Dimorphilus gyrociliatus TaxID=2664684 RepID=A0A7I8VD22_9ANNE|nr:DgyrCDS2343 [Dimorphilus gyrociliatus]
MYAKFLVVLLLGLATAEGNNDSTVSSTRSTVSTIQPTSPTQKTTVTPDDFPVEILRKECFIARMGLRVKESGKFWTMKKHPSFTVACESNKTMVNITLEETSFVNLKFSSDKSNYYLNSIAFKKDQSSTEYIKNELKLFSTSFNKTFKCYNQPKIELKNKNLTVDLEFKEFKFEIFKGGQAKNFSSTVNECAADKKTSNIVPIVVGAVLTGMIVIVLIAYLIGRRNNKSGYESV